MNLRDRLRLLKAAGNQRPRGLDPSAECEEKPEAGSAALPPCLPLVGSVATSDGPAGPALAGGCLQGQTVLTRAGEAFFLEHRHQVDAYRGPLTHGELLRMPQRAWELLGNLPACLRMDRAVFLDTETTGLAGGSGTHAFLIGLGYFQGEEFVVRQYFLRDYPEEEAMLEALLNDLSRFELLVSFNGKSFDWPLVQTRYRMARMRPPLGGAPHLDLLHPARRIWRDRLTHCNLTNLERNVLGLEREGDLPGRLIPQRYFDYLRSGNAMPLAAVVEHNRQDILSLVSLAACMGRLLLDPLSPSAEGELQYGDDLFGLGRLLEARGEVSQAIACYVGALERGTAVVVPSAVQRQLSAAYKRQREHQLALSLWEEMAADEGTVSLYPLIELAKYHEHISRDYSLAHRIAQQALAAAERRRILFRSGAAQRDWQEVRHRLARLERRLEAAR